MPKRDVAGEDPLPFRRSVKYEKSSVDLCLSEPVLECVARKRTHGCRPLMP